MAQPRQPSTPGEFTCEAPARFKCPELASHDPCCSAHGKKLCCKHYNDFHFVQVNRCTPETHIPEFP